MAPPIQSSSRLMVSSRSRSAMVEQRRAKAFQLSHGGVRRSRPAGYPQPRSRSGRRCTRPPDHLGGGLAARPRLVIPPALSGRAHGRSRGALFVPAGRPGDWRPARHAVASRATALSPASAAGRRSLVSEAFKSFAGGKPRGAGTPLTGGRPRGAIGKSAWLAGPFGRIAGRGRLTSWREGRRIRTVRRAGHSAGGVLAAGTFARAARSRPGPVPADTGCCEPPVAAATGNWPAAAATPEPTLPARDWLPSGISLPTTWLPGPDLAARRDLTAAGTWLPGDSAGMDEQRLCCRRYRPDRGHLGVGGRRGQDHRRRERPTRDHRRRWRRPDLSLRSAGLALRRGILEARQHDIHWRARRFVRLRARGRGLVRALRAPMPADPSFSTRAIGSPSPARVRRTWSAVGCAAPPHPTSMPARLFRQRLAVAWLQPGPGHGRTTG